MRETKDSEERRREFVDAAEKLFKKNGIMDTTVSNIVRELDVAKGLFYYYFRSKDDVIDAVSRKYNEAFNESMRKCMSTPDWNERLSQFTANCITSFRELNERLRGDSEEVDLSRLTMVSVEEARAASSAVLQELLEEGNRVHGLAIRNTVYCADLIVGGISYLALRGETDTQEIQNMIMELIGRERKES